MQSHKIECILLEFIICIEGYCIYTTDFSHFSFQRLGLCARLFHIAVLPGDGIGREVACYI
jgi:hypothetical protein